MQIVDLKQAPKHLETLAKWHHQEWADLNPGQSLLDRIDKMQDYLGESLVPSTYIALEGEQALGSAAITETDMENHADLSPWLASVYVDQQFRRKGIGSLLVRHVMHEARQAGVKELFLFTPDQANWYQKLGWETYLEEDYLGHNVTIMRIDLSNQV